MPYTSAEIEAFKKESVETIFGENPDLTLSISQTNDSRIEQSLRSVCVMLHGAREQKKNETYWNDVFNAPYYTAETLQGAAAFGGYVVLVPLTALLLIKVDIRQIRDASLRNRFIAEDERRLQESIQTLERLLRRFPRDVYHQLVRAGLDQQKEKLAWLSSEKKRNRWDAAMGFFSAGSNGATLLNSAGEIATNAALLAQTKSLVVGQIVPAVTTAAANGVSLAGTFALNPLSALCMGGVAASAFVQSIQHAKEFREGKEKVDALLEYLGGAQIDPGLAAVREQYQEDLQPKLKQRDGFEQKSKKSNFGFLTITALNAIVVITKTVIGALALAGLVAAAANPVGASVLLGLGIATLCAVGVGYQVYYYNQRKQKRYDSYRTGNDAKLDRDFQNRIEREHPNGMAKGFELRARYYGLIASQERRRQDLLTQVARDERKIYRRVHYSTDRDRPGDTRARIADFGKDLLARFHPRRLGHCDVENWSRKPENFDLQADSMEAHLRNLQEFLQQKIRARYDIHEYQGVGQQRGTVAFHEVN
jgi:hypothetical protein